MSRTEEQYPTASRAQTIRALRVAVAFVLAALGSACAQPAADRLAIDGLDGGAAALAPCEGDASCRATGGSPGCFGCTSTQCEIATCDGVTCSRSAMADGTVCSSGVCVAGTCVARGCGDGYVEPGPTPAREGCDDGNTTSGDGCSATYSAETLTLWANDTARIPTLVAVAGNGEALAVWVAELPAEDAREVRAQRLTSMGNAEGATIVVARIAGLGAEIEIASAGSEGAGWAVAWSAPGADRDGLGVRFAIVSDAGTVGTPIVVGDGDGDQRSPAIGAFQGGFAVALVDQGVPMSHGGVGSVVLRRFGAGGTAVGGAEVVSTSEHPSGEPALAGRGTELALAWAEGPDPMETSPAFESRVLVRRRGASGWSDASPITLQSGRASSPSLAWIDGDAVIATWVSRASEVRGDVEARALDASGLGAITTFPSPRWQASPVVARLAQGSWLAAWEHDERSPTVAVADPGARIDSGDLAALTNGFAGRSAAGVSMMRAPRGVWVVWSDIVVPGSGALDAGVPFVGGRAVRARLVPYPDLCRLCGGTVPFCERTSGMCFECDIDAHCPGLAGATVACVDRTCAYSCVADFADCDLDEGACEVDTIDDIQNCGGCGIACGTNEECVGGACVCAATYSLCGSTCVRLTDDPNHCGICNRACSGLYAVTAPYVCSGGACVLTCDSTNADCDGSWLTGCETDTKWDAANCGACGNACGGGEECYEGACQCVSGLSECPSVNGCFDVDSDVNHCGASCVDCTDPPDVLGAPEGAFACAEGSCKVACSAPYADCDGQWSTACEVNTQTSAQSCGSCGNTCLGRANTTGGSCFFGTCQLTCSSGYKSCDGSHVNGCEANVQTDSLNCGACGLVCANQPHAYSGSCSSGTCSYVCDSGYANCTSAAGCETSIWTDASNCGSCGFVCANQPHAFSGSCSSGACSYTCDSGWADCNGSTGCETQLGTLTNCTSCGNTCQWDCEGSGCNDATEVATGYYHSCAIRESGALVCWGWNGYGQIGDGSTTTRSTPVSSTGMTSSVSDVALGYAHTCVVRGGAARCFGMNSYGQLGNNSTTHSSTWVSVSGLTSGVVAVAAGENHSCALRSTGEVRCWGRNNQGQLGDGTTTNRHTPVTVSGLTSGVIAIAAGSAHTCALESDGDVRCWGDNGYGQLGNGTTVDRYVPTLYTSLLGAASALAVGYHHSCAVVSGALFCWGRNAYGQIGDGTTTNRTLRTAVSGLSSGVSTVSGGGYHTCARLTSGAARCWGYNGYGAVGDNTTTQRTTPAAVWWLSSGVTMIAGGGYHTCAVVSGGGMRCWGYNGYSAIGDGTTTQRLTPVTVTAP